MNNLTGIEKGILESWTGWDEAGNYGDIQFYNAKLKVSIGKYKAGDTVKCIALFLSESKITIFDNNGEIETSVNCKLVIED